MLDVVKQSTPPIFPQPLSSTGKEDKQYPEPGHNPPPATAVSISRGGQLLAEFPPLILDSGTHLKNANEALKQVMADLGIPGDTPVEFEVSPSGKVSVDMDHEKAAELERALNPEPGSESSRSAIFELRNSLVGASVSTVIQRIVSAASMAQCAADKNPAHLEQYYAWAKTMADESKSMSFRASFGGGLEPVGALVTLAGKTIGASEGLSLPA